MAREGYRSPPPPEQPNPNVQPDPHYPQPAPYSSSIPHPTIPEYERIRPPNMSTAQSDAYNADPARYHQARQPINEAVNSAFHGTENISSISPDILNQITAQITANVIQQLGSTNMPPPANIPPPATNMNGPASPTTTGSPPTQHRNAYTPPSPYRPAENYTQPPSSPPIVATQPRVVIPNYGRTSPPPEHRPTSPLSQASQTDERDTRDERIDRGARPKGPKRLSTGQDPTILEKIWQTLFDDDGQPTARLGQFLRGIAVHLIEDYEPKHSLIITPAKMQKYYEDTKLSVELYPWHMIFDDRTSSISRLYREIEAQHHLVQDKLDQRPDIPGLTPSGFERWATLLLRAHPDQEFERLQKTALDMPISNPDDKKERFPKEISRRLFPKYPDYKTRERLEKSMVTHCNIDLPLRHASNASNSSTSAAETPKPITTGRRTDSFVHPMASQPPLAQAARDGGFSYPVTSPPSQVPPFGSSIERERQPYSATVSEGAIDEDHEDDMPTPQPIERERKPYVAQPGGGKTYDEFNRPLSPSTDYLPPASMVRPARSGSIASHNRANDIPKSKPIPISIHQKPTGPNMDSLPTPDSASHRANTNIYGQQKTGQSTRNRSPSTSANGRYGHASDADLGYAGSYHSSADEDARNYHAYEKDRERFQDDRYDAARMKAYDVRERDREREGRQRYKSAVGLEGVPAPAPYANDDQYYRAPVSGYQTGPDGYQQYPSSYR